MFNLNNKTALVTGGASGIGRAIAELFAENGARVCVVDQHAGNLGKTVEKIRAAKGTVEGYSCDVTDQAAVVDVVRRVVEQFGQLDIVVNSAGISHIGTAETTTPADFEKVFNVNVKGVYNVMHAVINTMKAQGGGCILNIASVASSLGIQERFAYSMSKGAVRSMTFSVAKDFIDHHIRCNCISPARIHTAFVDDYLKKNYPDREQEIFEKLSKTQPIGRMGTPEEVASLALYLCSDEASFATGSDYLVDGGFTNLNTG